MSVPRHSNLVAVGLEILPGILLQTFGVGHLYAGRWAAGIGIMLLYWFLQAINVALMPLLIGYITAPLTWLAFLVLSPTDVLDSAARP